MASVLVTGANGFVGRALCEHLEGEGWQVVRALRHGEAPGSVRIGDIGPDTDWGAALAGCQAVVHLAARVHVMDEHSADPLGEFRAVNSLGTVNLARQAAAAGVGRFVFLSSIKVNGEAGAFSEADAPTPQDAYGLSKWEAEQGLREVAGQTGMGIVVVRPPLVYGPGVKANFARLMRAVAQRWPLPFGAVDNRRSMIYLGNLTSAIAACLKHPAAAGRTYLVSDGEHVSTPELIRRLGRALEVSPRLLSVPPALIRWLGRALGKKAEVERLLGSLIVDGDPIQRETGWVPPYSMQAGLHATCEGVAKDFKQK